MPLLSEKEVLNLKLSSIAVPSLKEFSARIGVDDRGSGSELIKRLLDREINEGCVDEFIKEKYIQKIQERRAQISDEELKAELMKVESFAWGVIQGQLDQKIQTEYVRKIVRYEDLLSGVKAKLHDDVTNYVICTWFNHWTTLLIEEHISTHSRIIPTLKNIKGIDIFFGGQPFDLKVTYLPRDYDAQEALTNPRRLAVWMYENQGAQRFGADNRLFVVLFDQNEPERSWELKRDFDLVFRSIDEFFDAETVANQDEVVFTFRKRTYTAVSKVLMVTK